MADLITGADSVGGEAFCDDIYNSLKNHWRADYGGDPCGELSGIQPGMIVNDSYDNRLYLALLESGCACSEILQSCVPLSDDEVIGFGDDWDVTIGFDSANNRLEITGNIYIETLGDFSTHWRDDYGGDPCIGSGAPPNITAGMIINDSYDDRLYLAILDSDCSCSEILQDCVPLSDDKTIDFGNDADSSIGYETTNDALIFGIPVSTGASGDNKRGLIFCDEADIDVDFTGLLGSSLQPRVALVDLDTDSYLGFSFASDDTPEIRMQSQAYYNLIQTSQAEGLAGADLRIGLDPSLYTLNILPRALIGNDLALTPAVDPTLRIWANDASDSLFMYHDGANAYFQTDDGNFVFQTDEGVNTNTILGIQGKGTGFGNLRVYDQDQAEYVSFYANAGSGHLTMGGVAPGNLHLQYNVAQNIRFWWGLAAGNPYFYIYGWITAGAAVRYARMRMEDTNDEFTIEAEDNANHEGITVLIPQADQKFRVRGAASALRFYVKSDGELGTNQTASATTLGNVTDRLPIYDENQALVGYVPLYDAIT